MLRFAPLVLAIAGLGACAATDAASTGPATLRGIVMTHAPTAIDSIRLAALGRVVSVVRRDTLVVLLSDADPTRIEAVPGVRVAGPSLGSSPTGSVEVLIGAASTEAAAAVMMAVGRVVGQLHDGTIDGFVAANRLRELDGYSSITYLYITINPPHEVCSSCTSTDLR